MSASARETEHMPTYEATPYRCPSCNQQNITRVRTPVSSWSSPTPIDHTIEYVCPAYLLK